MILELIRLIVILGILYLAYKLVKKMKIELGWFYISIDRDGIHIEIERFPSFWVVLSFNTHWEKIA